MIGDSAGAYLSAMVALAGEQSPFAGGYKSDPYAAVSSRVKVCVGVYGIYDLAAAWQADLVTRPNDRPGEKFLGVPLTENRKLYFEASPISYMTSTAKNDGPAVRSDASRPAFLLAWGT